MRYHLRLLILALLVVACATPATPETTEPLEPTSTQLATVTVLATSESAYPLPEATPEIAAYPGPRPTPEGTFFPVTITPPTPAPPSTPTPSPAPTFTPALPDPAALDWEVVAQDVGVLSRLTGLTTAVFHADPSPDGRWWAATLLREGIGMGWYRTALYVLDGTGDAHWLANTSGNNFSSQHAWLPGERLLWVDQGSLFVASTNGQNRRDLGAPEPIHEVWCCGGNIALAGGKTVLWRVDLVAGTWEAVESQDVSTPRGYLSGSITLSIAPGGTFAAALAAGGNLWHVPLAAGQSATRVGLIEIAGSDAGPIPPPQPLADSPFWILGNHPDIGPQANKFFDSRNGTLVPIGDVLPRAGIGRLPMAAPDRRLTSPPGGGGTKSNLFPSPDGRWLAVYLSPPGTPTAEPIPAVELYIAPSSNLDAGRVFADATLVAWQREPPAVLLRFSGGPALARVVLPDGEPTTLLDRLDPLPWPSRLPITPDPIFVAQLEHEQLRLHAFDRDARPLATLDLPVLVTTEPSAYGPYDLPVFSILGAAPPARLLFTTLRPEAQTLWMWDAAP